MNFFKQFSEPIVYSTAIITAATMIIVGKIGIKFSKNVHSNEFIKEKLKTEPLKIIVISAVAAPLFEELVYRKLIFGWLRTYSKPLAYGLSSFLFAFEHYGFNFKYLIKELKTDFINVPVFTFNGFALAYAYDSSNCILTSILAHCINNTLSMVSQYYDLD
ncbi:hypothetical protein PIROE2DRAFT_10482 [Piromyces sp. E2]|nr:hypothetical protein PIROE2DRAFT_10482 [Piromyces sp. E2]|eukprot:OUM63068.1 hypothetical protein PIROE2DRAFT_10482 [Piromyces sp. E2]